MLAESGTRLSAEATLFLDSGIRKGSDILVAAALGAAFCFVGRAALFGVAADGARGARRVIEILASEVRYAQAMIGAKTGDRLSRAMLLRDGQLFSLTPGMQRPT